MKTHAFLLLASFALLSCATDDEDTDLNCSTCTYTSMGTPNEIEYCDNEDGTITVIFEDGTTETDPLGELTFSQFISSQEMIGASCD